MNNKKALILIFGLFLLVGFLGVVSAEKRWNFNNYTLNVSNDLYFGGVIYGDGSGLTNLNSSLINQSIVNYWTKSGTDLTYVNGNVGIGTTSPSYKLDVNGTGRFEGDLNLGANHLNLGNSWKIYNSGNILTQTISGTGGAEFYLVGDGSDYTNTYLMIGSNVKLNSNGNSYFNGGNLGIGIVSPTANLQVAQGTSGAGTITTTATGTTVTGSGTQFLNTFKVGDTITANAETHTISAIASNTSMTTDAWTGANSGVPYTLVGGTRFSVLGNGNVGIGTTSPGSILHTYGNNKLILSQSSDTSQNSVAGIEMQVHSTGAYKSKVIGIRDGTSYGTGLAFYTTDNVNPTGSSYLEKMRIDSNGNVGIGTTAPNYKLEVAGDLNVSNVLFLNTTTDNVGIGTTSPGAKLEVAEPTNDFSTTAPTVLAKYSGTGALSAGYLAKNYYGSSHMLEWSTHGVRLGSRTTANGGNGNLYLTYGSDSAGITVLGNNGNVGIGTTSPSKKLDVNGSIRSLTGNVYLSTSRFSDSINSGYLNINPQGKLVALWDGTNSIALNVYNGNSVGVRLVGSGNSYFNGGNVGIGTTSPGAKLEVNGNILLPSTNRISFNGETSGTSRGPYINYNSGQSTLDIVTGYNISDSNIASNGIRFGVASGSSWQAKMQLSSSGGLSLGSSYIGTDAGAGNMIISGNVGIGTASPDAKLTVNGEINLTSSRVKTFTEGGALVVSG